MKDIQIIYDEAHQRRLIVFQRGDSTFGFKEERFSAEPMEMDWIPLSLDSACRCDTAERVLSETRGRVPWLRERIEI
ncbi:MAG: hypothetical protein E6L09_04140 [Verrucomicrobia bacterium]|nr:MAG: hypothetical protein E6L09_04140 [Verrucomicrobiota bacterium]